MKSNLIFIGMPAVGKSTVGIVVAKRLGMNFIDTDLLIQEQEKKLLREIIAEVGQDGFLKIENQVNADLEAEDSVISPGGSVIYCSDAMKHYKEIGTVVYLKASYQTIKKRIHNPKKRGVVLRKDQSFRDRWESIANSRKSGKRKNTESRRGQDTERLRIRKTLDISAGKRLLYVFGTGML